MGAARFVSGFFVGVVAVVGIAGGGSPRGEHHIVRQQHHQNNAVVLFLPHGTPIPGIDHIVEPSSATVYVFAELCYR
jgi:hypothetical protein